MTKAARLLHDVIEQVGGPTKASAICKVSNNTLYAWRKAGKISLSAPCVRLARAAAKTPAERYALIAKLSGVEEE